jgi:F-type H+-transporting ATPase subunit b
MAMAVLASLIEVNPGLAFWTLVTFLVVMFVLRRVAWGPILGLIEQREKEIANAIDSAKRERAEAERLLAEQKSAIADARREAAEMMAKSRDEVAKFREELVAKSKQDAEALVTQARKQIDEERAKAVAEVKTAAVDLVISATAKLLGQNLDEPRHKQLVNEYISKLPTRPNA